jgi:peptidoglycan/LPS O-acetylase OafA/YrhL
MTTKVTSENPSRVIGDIEVLRAVAILFTLFAHLGALFVWGNSFHQKATAHLAFWGGVDLFFAISGFVIARHLLHELSDCSTPEEFWRTTGAFWIRRAFRILPSAWLWLVIVLIASLTFNHAGAFKDFWVNFADMIAAMLHVANFHHYLQMHNLTPWGANSVYWSLSLEEQFYLLLPLLILFTRSRLTIVLLLLAALQLFLEREQGSLLWEIRSDGLLLGVLLAKFSASETYHAFNPSLFRHRLIRVPLMSLAVMSLAALPSLTLNITPFYTGMLAIVSTGLVWIASYDKSYIIAPGKIKSVLMWIGNRSFAIYLIHTPVFHATREIWYRIEPVGTHFGGSYTLRFFLTATLLIVILAELNFRFIETPLRKKGKAYANKMLQKKSRT